MSEGLGARAAQEAVAGARVMKLPGLLKLGYACGGLVDGTALHPLNVFLLFYLTSVCHMPGALAGGAISLGLLVDAVMDPLIGSLSDRLHSRLGRRLPFMLAALIPTAASFVLLFSIPPRLGLVGDFVWLALVSVVLRISVSAFLLPHQALGAELTDDYSQRSSIMSWRWGLFMIGGVSGILLGFGVFLAGPTGLQRRAAYMPFAMSLAAIILAGGLIASRTALLTRSREHGAVLAKGSAFQVFGELAEVFRNRTFRVLFFGSLLFFVGFGVNTILGLDANAYFWRLTTGQTQSVTLALFVGLLLGAPLAGQALAVAEKRTVQLIMLSGLLLAQAAPVMLSILGLFPFHGVALARVLSAISFVYGAMLGSAGVASASMMADAADEHEHLFGSRREGVYYAGLAFSNKAAAGVGALIAGLVLQFIAFPTGAAGQGASAVPQHVVQLLGLAYGPGAALLSAAAVVVTFSYRIDRRRHVSILASLAERRQSVAAAGLAP